MALSGGITLGDNTAVPPVLPVNNQVLTPTPDDTAFSVAFVPFNPGDPSAGMLLLTNNGTFTMKDSTGTNDVTVPTNHFLTYQVGGIPTWKSDASGNWSDATNWRVGVPNGATASANFSHAITAPRTVTLDQSMTVANLFFNSPQKYTIVSSGAGTTSVNVSSNLGVYGGSHEISAPLNLTAPVALAVSGTGSALKLTGHVSGKLSTLSVTSGGKLDVTNNNLIVTGTAAGTWNGSAYTGVTGLIAAGKGDGNWNGTTGVITSVAGASDYTSLGVATGADAKGLTGTATDTFNGQTVHATDTIVMFTYGGDANLDGMINIDDYTQIDSSVSTGGALKGWYNGDFNYDGEVNIDDYTIIDSNIGIQGTPFSSAGGASIAGVAAVPEPAALGLLSVGALSLLGRRRRTTN